MSKTWTFIGGVVAGIVGVLVVSRIFRTFCSCHVVSGLALS
ncbi:MULTISPECIES: hypothetical protein [unclassified Desulfovibrio]